MNRWSVTRTAAVAVAACLIWGGSSLAAATDLASLAESGDLLDPGAAAVATTAAESAASIPLPPSAYPGMVGLATAALSVWRYRRRRRR